MVSERNRIRITSILATAAALSLSWGSGAALQVQPLTYSTNAALDSLIAREMSGAGIMGLAAAVIVDRHVVWLKGYGFADQARTKPFAPTTIMNVGSIAKPFTGVAMMRAVQEGRLALDDDINTYLPFRVVSPHRPSEKITLWHLATHTSGIADRWEVYSGVYHYGGDSPDSLGRFLEDYFTRDGKYYLRENFLDARPGTRREYSNIATALAGYIVERVSGEPLNVYTRKHIFTPLGMKGTGWFLTEETATKCVA